MSRPDRPQLQLHDLKPDRGARKKRIRVGRGEGGRRGKTAGRGTKGIKARGSLRPGFEGGQTPLARRLPKLKGFRNPNRQAYTVVNVGSLEIFEPGTTVTPDQLRELGLVKKRGQIKVLAEGELTKPLLVQAHAFSQTAADKITAAGGETEKLSR